MQMHVPLCRSAPLPLSLFGEEEEDSALALASLPPVPDLPLLMAPDDPALQPPPVPEQPAAWQLPPPVTLQLDQAEQQIHAAEQLLVPSGAQPAGAEPHDAQTTQDASVGVAVSMEEALDAAAEDPVQEATHNDGSLESSAATAPALDASYMQQQDGGLPDKPAREQSGSSGIDWDSVGFSFAVEELPMTEAAAPVTGAHEPDLAAQASIIDHAAEGNPSGCSGAERIMAAQAGTSRAEDSAGEAHAGDSAAALADTAEEDWDYGDFAAAEDPSLPQEALDGPAAVVAPEWDGHAEEPSQTVLWDDEWEGGGISLPVTELEHAALPADSSHSLPGCVAPVEPAMPDLEEPPGWDFGEPWRDAHAAAEPVSVHQEPDLWGVLAALDDAPAEAHAAAALDHSWPAHDLLYGDAVPHDPQPARDGLNDAAVAAADSSALPELGSEWGGDRWQAWHLLMQVRSEAPRLDMHPMFLSSLTSAMHACVRRRLQMSCSRAASSGRRAAPLRPAQRTCWALRNGACTLLPWATYTWWR